MKLVEGFRTSHNGFACKFKLPKNKNHQNTLFAALMIVKNYADAVISLDVNFQDDIDILDEFIKQ